MDDLHAFKRQEERGLGDILVACYPGLRKYFSEFLRLPFRAKAGTESLLDAIMLLRQLDNGEIKRLPGNVPTNFVPYELQRILKGKDGKVQRNAWELGVAIAMKDALRLGDVFIPQSKQHVSFWDLMLDQHDWQATREAAYIELQQPTQENVKTALILEFHQIVGEAEKRFELDSFAEIRRGSLRLQRDDKPKFLSQSPDCKRS